MKMANKKQAGVTLLELLMVVGIAAVIAVAALMFFRATDESNKVALEAKNLGTLASGVANMFAAQGNYNGLNNDVMRASNVLPDSMMGAAASTIRHSWSGAGVAVAAATISSVDDAFTITYTNVPDKSCVDLASKTITAFNQLDINATTVTGVADITTACNAGAANTMIWTR